MTSGRGRCPFTALQWEELEHQALIFKYLVAGMPIPPDLLFAVKRTGWSYLQMGLGRKVDPEPGRCRRTDGKKWRCSRDAYPDSKYCERHMHRGKNRSRKPVEAMTPPTPASNAPPPPPGNCLSSALLNPRPSSPASHSLSQISSVADEPHRPDLYGYGHPRFSHAHLENHFAFPHSSSRPAEQVNTVHSLMDSSGSCDPDYRRSGYAHGGLREADERALFAKHFSNSSPDDPLQLTPLTMGSSFSKQSAPSGLAHGRGVEFSDHSQLRRLAGASKQQEDPHCYLLGRDLKCQTPAKVEGDDENQKGVHRLLDDWAAHKGREPWLDTQLSMSIADSSHDYPIFHSRTHNDGLGFQ